jgi:hypothetical protein
VPPKGLTRENTQFSVASRLRGEVNKAVSPYKSGGGRPLPAKVTEPVREAQADLGRACRLRE